jgi:hypothetical protein
MYVMALVMGSVLWLSVWNVGVSRGQAIYVSGLIVLLAFAALEFMYFLGLMAQRDKEPEA